MNFYIALQTKRLPAINLSFGQKKINHLTNQMLFSYCCDFHHRNCWLIRRCSLLSFTPHLVFRIFHNVLGDWYDFLLCYIYGYKVSENKKLNNSEIVCTVIKSCQEYPNKVSCKCFKHNVPFQSNAWLLNKIKSKYAVWLCSTLFDLFNWLACSAIFFSITQTLKFKPNEQ